MKNAERFKKKLILQIFATVLPLAFASAAPAASITTTGNNFTMLTSIGSMVGSDSNVSFTWDGTFNTSVSGAGNATLSSSTPFYGYNWSTHNVSIYGPGTYTVFSDCAPGNPGCGSGTAIPFTVAPNQVGVHLLFDWGINKDMDLVNVWDLNATFPGNPPSSWDAASSDANGDGVRGIPFVDGTFVGFNANFNVNGVVAMNPSPTPVPAAAWLLGSGLLGLMGFAKRKIA